MRLRGRTALVTGASSGIGRAVAVAVRLGREGAHVIVADLQSRPKWSPDGDVPTAVVIESSEGWRLTSPAGRRH